MEPKLIRKDIKYQKKTLIVVSLLVISLFIGGSFALLSSSDETEEVVTFKTGNFNLEVATAGTLSLDGEVPKSYDDGFKNNDITLTLTNTGSLEIGKYDVKLEGDTTSTLESNYIRYSVSDDDGKTYLASKLLSDTNNIIYTGYNLKTTKVLKVKLWIDEGAGSNALKKSYNGKINVELYQNEDTLVDVVKSKLVSNYSGSNESFEGGLIAVNNDGNLYHETNSETIREYRYNGPTVNNYVTFNDEIWRIIGVFKDENNLEHVKIVRNMELKEIMPSTYTVNEKSYKVKSTSEVSVNLNGITGGTNDWASAGLQYWLNTNNDSNDVKGYMNYINDESKSMIEQAKYYLGSVDGDYENKVTISPKLSYIYERATNGCLDNIGPSTNNNRTAVEGNTSCRVWTGNQATWDGKIGLMYPSDYGFSINNKFWEGYNFDVFGTEEISKTSWLNVDANHDHYEWLITPATGAKEAGIDWYTTGYLEIDDVTVNNDGVRPCLYLKTNVKITSGDGTSANPYKLILE